MQLQVTNNATKSDLIELAHKTVYEISENGRPMEAVERLTKMEFLIDQIKKNKDFIDLVRSELEKEKKAILTPTGTKIELCEAGIKYDYASTNDPEWQVLNRQMLAIKDKLSARETFLKSVPDEGMDILIDGGEVVKIFKPAKSSTSTFKTTLAK